MNFSNLTIVGIGGIGSNLVVPIYNPSISRNLSYIKKIVLHDFDKVEYHNLNRTPFEIKDVGRYKVDGARDLLEREGMRNCVKTRYSSITALAKTRAKNSVIIDCTDGYFTPDLIQQYNYEKIDYKLNYDGAMWMTITTRPYARDRKGNYKMPVEFFSGRGYEVVPSLFLIPVILCHIFTVRLSTQDELPRKTEQTIFNAKDIIDLIFKKEEI